MDTSVLWPWEEPGLAVYHIPVIGFEDLVLVASNPIGLVLGDREILVVFLFTFVAVDPDMAVPA